LAAVPVTYVAFDLLWQARSLLRSPYTQRRALLDGLALAAEHVSMPPSPARPAPWSTRAATLGWRASY
jgi:bifunctional non-homologous end joining protein LigD